MNSVELVGVSSNLGNQASHCNLGASAFRDFLLQKRAHVSDKTSLHWHAMLSPRPGNPLSALSALNQKLAAVVNALVRREQPFAVIGGDHSVALGTWRGVLSAQDMSRFGLLWIDAHMDAHNFMSSPSGHVHGMPVNALLGGDAQLQSLYKSDHYLLPAHLVLFGVRSFEPWEEARLERRGIRVFTIDEIKRLGGVQPAMQQAVHCLQECSSIGVSLDLDAIDPKQAPGVSTPESDGLDARELCKALAEVRDDGRLIGMEIVEFDPLEDADGQTAAVMQDVLDALFSENQRRH